MEQYPIEEDIIELNVGGRYFATYRSTLISHENSMLEAMFSGRHPMKKDKKGRYFIDRDGEQFHTILNYLRTGKLLWPSDPQLKEQLKLELEYYGLLQPHTVSADLNSVILKDKKELQYQLQCWLQEDQIDVSDWKLLYRASQDGFAAKSFHSKCDNRGPTLTLIQSTGGWIFGGYTPASWTQSRVLIHDHRIWIFSLRNPSGMPMKMNTKGPHGSPCIYGNNETGPTFGGGYDLYSKLTASTQS